MLILKEPISLKSLSNLVYVQDGFWERLEGNYKLIQAKYQAEDLFLLLNQPPEVYVQEHQMTTLVVNNQNQTKQKITLEMIHNLFNRLLMAGTKRFTYQDAVFVQSMLAKLGVRNVSEFMRQLYEMQRETRQVSQLSDLYETYMEAVGTIIQSAKKYREEKQDLQGEDPHALYWIHDEIFKRLQTGNVYHTIAAFQKDAVNAAKIGNLETSMAEHSKTSALLKLNMLENGVWQTSTPLPDSRVNIFEKDADRKAVSRDEWLNKLAFAVLLNISDQLYQLRCGHIQKNRRFWLQFEGNFRQITERTWECFLAYHLQGKYLSRTYAKNQYQKTISELRRQEIVHLQKVLGISENGREGKIIQKKEYAAALEQEVYRLNEENRKKWQEAQTAQKELPENRQIKFDQERTRRETLLMLEYPEMEEHDFDREPWEQKVPLFHKESQTASPEIIREQVGNPLQLQRNVAKTSRKVETERMMVKQQVRTQEDHFWKQNTENISEVLQRGILRQMDRISDQVYRKLEKKLADERKRRGY